MDETKKTARKGIFAKVAKAALKDGLGGVGGGQFFRRGKYKCTVVECSHNPEAYRGENITIRLRIDAAQQTDTSVQPNAVGSTAVVVEKIGLGDKGQWAFQRVARFGAALINADELSDEEADELVTEMVDEAQTIRGKAINCEVIEHTKADGNKIDRVVWSHDPLAHDDAEVEKRRKELDAG